MWGKKKQEITICCAECQKVLRTSHYYSLEFCSWECRTKFEARKSIELGEDIVTMPYSSNPTYENPIQGYFGLYRTPPFIKGRK